MGLKVVVTDYALASWYASCFNLEEMAKQNNNQQAARHNPYHQATQFLKNFNKTIKSEKDLSDQIKKSLNKGLP